MKPILFYGAGKNAQSQLGIYKKFGIIPVCFVDKDPDKQNQAIEGISILSPTDAKRLYQDFLLVITPRYPLKKQIRDELVESGFVSEENIINAVDDKAVMYESLCNTMILPQTVSDGVVEHTTATSEEISARISSAYQKQHASCTADGLWKFLSEMRADVHETLLTGNTADISEMLSNPMSNNLTYGFEDVNKIAASCVKNSPSRVMAALVHRLGEIWGAVDIVNTEVFGLHDRLNFRTFYSVIDVEAIIKKLESLFSCKIHFPNPYCGEAGIQIGGASGVEIVSFRALQALHQAFTIWKKIENRGAKRVLEIGAGLGRTAYYCKTLFDIDYTIIDLPITQVASAHFLMQSIGENAVSLYGEPQLKERIKILPPHAFLDGDLGKFDLIVNFDSLTEMDYSTMKAYWNKIKTSANAFLSVNHECNQHTVRELICADDDVKTYSRHFYDMRNGYAEEYVTF